MYYFYSVIFGLIGALFNVLYHNIVSKITLPKYIDAIINFLFIITFIVIYTYLTDDYRPTNKMLLILGYSIIILLLVISDWIIKARKKG